MVYFYYIVVFCVYLAIKFQIRLCFIFFDDWLFRRHFLWCLNSFISLFNCNFTYLIMTKITGKHTVVSLTISFQAIAHVSVHQLSRVLLKGKKSIIVLMCSTLYLDAQKLKRKSQTTKIDDRWTIVWLTWDLLVWDVHIKFCVHWTFWSQTLVIVDKFGLIIFKQNVKCFIQ